MATVTIVVDGFSTDSTAKVAKEAGTTSMIEQSDRKIYGKGVAMKAGLAEAASRYCAVSRRIHPRQK